MSTTKHTPTPGPWVTKRDTGLRVRIQSASGGTLANMTSRPLPYGANFSYDQIEANARLIAAAPDLVEALKEIETICTESAGDCRKRMGTRVGNALVTARAALARAGVTP